MATGRFRLNEDKIQNLRPPDKGARSYNCAIGNGLGIKKATNWSLSLVAGTRLELVTFGL